MWCTGARVRPYCGERLHPLQGLRNFYSGPPANSLWLKGAYPLATSGTGRRVVRLLYRCRVLPRQRGAAGSPGLFNLYPALSATAWP